MILIFYINKKSGLKTTLLNKLVKEIKEKEDLFDDIDYQKADFEWLNSEIERSTKQWLLNAIKQEKIAKEYSSEDKVFYAVMDRMNILNDENRRIQTSIKSDITDMSLILNKKRIRKKYYCYKIISKILFGKKRKYYKNKTETFHKQVRRIRKLEENIAD